MRVTVTVTVRVEVTVRVTVAVTVRVRVRVRVRVVSAGPLLPAEVTKIRPCLKTAWRAIVVKRP